MTPPLRRDTPWPLTVDLVAFDFDGVMTDNTVWTFADGTEAVRCHRGDGLGVAALRAAGFAAIILSTERNPVVAARGAKLHLPVVQGCDDKAAALAERAAHHGHDLQRVVYLGNDVNDLGCLHLVGLPVAVADAHPAVVDAAALVLGCAGGAGAVRELCDLLVEHSVPAAVNAAAR